MKLVFPIRQSPKRLILRGTKSDGGSLERTTGTFFDEKPSTATAAATADWELTREDGESEEEEVELEVDMAVFLCNNCLYLSEFPIQQAKAWFQTIRRYLRRIPIRQRSVLLAEMGCCIPRQS